MNLHNPIIKNNVASIATSEEGFISLKIEKPLAKISFSFLSLTSKFCGGFCNISHNFDDHHHEKKQESGLN